MWLVVTNELQPEDITFKFCRKNDISLSSALSCRNLMFMWRISSKESSHPLPYNTQQPTTDCPGDSELSRSQSDTSTTCIKMEYTEQNNYINRENICIKEENIEIESSNEETTQDITFHSPPKSEQGSSMHQTVLKFNNRKCLANRTEISLGCIDDGTRMLQSNYSACLTTPTCLLEKQPREQSKCRLQCEHCDYRTGKRSSLIAHMQKHFGLQCEHCECRPKNSRALKHHMRKHSGNWLQCEKCDYRTAYKHVINAHMRKHSGNMLQCEHCDYKTEYNHLIKVHMRKHSGNLLQCEQCGYRTADDRVIKAHMRKHSGKLLQCEQCEYKAAYRCAIKIHMRKHSRTDLQKRSCHAQGSLPSALFMTADKRKECLPRI